MSKFVVIIFPSESVAYDGTRALKQLHEEGNLTLYGMTVLAKEASGNIAIKQTVDQGALGLAVGMLAGGLIGLIGGPAGSALGMGTGAAIGGLGDIINMGIRSDFLESISNKLTSGKAAVVAEVDEDWMTPLDTRMKALGGEVIRQWRSDFEDEQIEGLAKERQAEFATLKDELAHAGADAKNVVNRRLEETRAKLEAAGKRAEAQRNQLDQEVDAKRKEMQRQLAQASAETKARIEKRLAAMEVDSKRRTELLKRAWSLTKEALAA